MSHKLPRERRRKIRKSDRSAYAKSASKCTNGKLRDALTTKWTPRDQDKHAKRKLGTFGPASEVVRINPETMEPYE